MQAQHLTIESKHRPMIDLHASMADFRCSDGDAVSAAIVVTSPHLSLYCLDEQTQCAIFVELPVLPEDTTVLSIPQVLTLAWLALMDRYLAQHARGIPILAVRYDHLNAHRAQVVTAILEHCGLATTQAAGLLGVFARDAQAGSLLARENPDQGNQRQLTGEEVAEMTRIVQRHPVITTADFVAPGTLPVSAD